MLPVQIVAEKSKALIVGNGAGARARLAAVRAAGFTDVPVFASKPERALSHEAGQRLKVGLPAIADMGPGALVFIAELPIEELETVLGLAKTSGALVNVRDAADLCDFHMPALVRRGDLLLTVSTGGRAPAMAALICRWLEQKFGDRWAAWLSEAAGAREDWRAAGAPAAEVIARTEELVSEKGWLP